MVKLIIVLVVALVFEAVGVVFLGQGLKEIGEAQKINVAEIARLVGRGLTNRSILLGVLMETIFFIALLIMLARWDVSLIWPLTALGFVLTTLAARFIGHEEVSSIRWSGVILIMVGAALVAWSEKVKTTPAVSPTATDLLVRKE